MARNKNPEITINRILDTSMDLFLKKGYDNTTIQDIVNELGDLSKGAIYHHFKSKEEIMEAVIPRIYRGSDEDVLESEKITCKNGLDKLKKTLLKSLKNPAQERIIKAAPNLMKNPRILTQQLFDVVGKIVPTIVEPIIREGMNDGSINTNNPKELAESFIILMNVWMNPSVFFVSKEEFRQKFEFLKELLVGLGMPILDEEFIEVMEQYRSIIEDSKK
ncbi:helix-turn-helix transcriptional regulator [Clostridium botulinum]|uniref:TetR/AcrR family transcriptional regulator n=1 Tax=Clostridium TaxID=1485 RepID=UPI0002D29739|nr:MULTISPECIES: helix-turn-helix domain-containing protein [Clostridium]AIY79698.1 bacterial regulatory s, tetR family protein [Clostridium botulinum 202F]KAI3344945.1 TetR/AcrR family transcriptional regulator [Clostridium botulinum]KFX53834.1 TetR family transcriptional regulator [Clostridium botulinum]KFX57195.1 TetR family transcriptional regulator [Clostridium botulinum]KON13997.1 TetR family transcriptional regulator [Clostridium botulinum]